MGTINNGITSNNRGVELIINEKKKPKKKFFTSFEKIISIFNKEIIISFYFSFDLSSKKYPRRFP
jgi:uncharacterized protein YrrD